MDQPSARIAAITPEETDSAQNLDTRLQACDARITIVDFDETLFLQNSTLTYLANLKPAILAAIICKLIAFIKPWRILPGQRKSFIYKEWMQVVATSILMPWSLPLWSFYQAPRIARENTNHALLESLQRADKKVDAIASFGFRPVLNPLLKAMGVDAPLYCAGFWNGFQLRRRGKRQLLERKLGPDALADSVIISDSDNDSDILAICKTPIIIQWPEANIVNPFSKLYFPFLYTDKIKHPNSRYILSGILLCDVLAIILAYAWLMPRPIFGAAGLLLMHVGLWAVYELGYVENDLMALKKEENGTIPKDFQVYADRINPVIVWLTATFFSGIGLFLVLAGQSIITLSSTLDSVAVPYAIAFGLWMGFLLFSFLLFKFYNHANPENRLLLYPMLQVIKFIGYGLVAAMNVVGLCLFLGLILARWLPYLIYRVSKTRWTGLEKLLVLEIFVLSALFCLAARADDIISIQTAVILVWLTARARREIMRYLKEFRFI